MAIVKNTLALPVKTVPGREENGQAVAEDFENQHTENLTEKSSAQQTVEATAFAEARSHEANELRSVEAGQPAASPAAASLQTGSGNISSPSNIPSVPPLAPTEAASPSQSQLSSKLQAEDSWQPQDVLLQMGRPSVSAYEKQDERDRLENVLSGHLEASFLEDEESEEDKAPWLQCDVCDQWRLVSSVEYVRLHEVGVSAYLPVSWSPLLNFEPAFPGHAIDKPPAQLPGHRYQDAGDACRFLVSEHRRTCARGFWCYCQP